MQQSQNPEENAWRRIRRVARHAGRGVLEHALQLHYAAQSPTTPQWARAVAYGALAYLVLPADAIPDLIPGAGYTDDMSVLAAALTTIAMQITPEIRVRARSRVGRLFGE
ncbi:MAG TPA: YkvA family protein [Steroidobacteraceae bacterium]